MEHATTWTLLPAALIGSVLNWTIFYSIRKMKVFNHAFGFLSGNQALADALHSTTFLLYFCPMVLLESEAMKTYSHHAGFFLLFCYELSVLTHFVISLNRFFAVYMPFQYKNIFSDSNTKVVIGLLWAFTGSIAVFFYQYLCKFYYEESIQFLTFESSELCGVIGWYGDFLKNSTLVVFIVFIDLMTVFRVRAMSRKVVSTLTENAHNRISKREMRFLKQTVFQGAVFLLELLTYFFIPKYFQNQWIVFFATSFAWVSVHAADGIVVLLCNPEIRKFVTMKDQQKSSQMETQNSSCSNH